MLRTRPLRFLAVAALASGVLVLTACNPPAAVSTEPLPDDLDALIAAAQEEGTVTLGAGGHTEAQVQLLADEFEKAYGITVEYVRENTGQISQKVQAQQDAGNLAFDVISLNDASTLSMWADEDVLAEAPVDNAGDVLPKLASGSDSFIAFTWSAAGYVYNESKLDAADLPATWADLAAADGTKAFADPGASGAALTFVAALTQTDAGALAAFGDADVLTSESALALGQMVSTGEADYGIPGIEHDVATARAAGEPLAMGYPEGPLAALPSYIAPLNGAAHPAAARLLVQFSLSEEFQQAQRELGSRSVLTTVDTPADLADITDDRMLVLDQADLAERKDELIAEFAAAVQ